LGIDWWDRRRKKKCALSLIGDKERAVRGDAGQLREGFVVVSEFLALGSGHHIDITIDLLAIVVLLAIFGIYIAIVD
jgi:hypothetical protein